MNIKSLKKIGIFAGLSKQDLGKVKTIINEKSIKQGDYLFKRGDQRKNFFVILNGHIKLSQEAGKNEEGWAILKEDDFISAQSLINPNSSHQQTAIALTDSEVLVVNGADYGRLVKRNPRISTTISNELICGLNHRLLHSTNKLVALYKTGQTASSEEDLEILAGKTLKIILNVIKARKAIFLIFDHYKKESICLAFIGYPRNIAPYAKMGIDKDRVMASALTGEKKFKEAVKEEMDFLRSTYKMKEALGCPIFFGGKLVGMILLGDKIKGTFSINNEILLTLISHQIAGSIYRAQKRKELMAEEEMKRVYAGYY